MLSCLHVPISLECSLECYCFASAEQCIKIIQIIEIRYYIISKRAKNSLNVQAMN